MLTIRLASEGLQAQREVAGKAIHCEWAPEPKRIETSQEAWRRRLTSWRSWQKGVSYALVISFLLSLIFLRWLSDFLLVLNVLDLIFQFIWTGAEKFASQDLIGMMDNPSPAPQFAVKVDYRYEALGLGEDEGVLVFHAGWMNFMGRQSHFSVRRTDLHYCQKESSPERIAIVVDEIRPYTGCRIQPYAKAIIDGRKQTEQDIACYKAFERWSAEGAAPLGEPILPVATMKPSVAKPRWVPPLTWSLFVAAILGAFALHQAIVGVALLGVGGLIAFLVLPYGKPNPEHAHAIANRLPIDIPTPWHEADLIDLFRRTKPK